MIKQLLSLTLLFPFLASTTQAQSTETASKNSIPKIAPVLHHVIPAAPMMPPVDINVSGTYGFFNSTDPHLSEHALPTHIPRKQARSMSITPGVRANNDGFGTAAGLFVETEIQSNNLWTNTSSTFTLWAGNSEIVGATAAFTPYDYGTHQVQMQVTGNSFDADPADNTGTFEFNVTDTVYAFDTQSNLEDMVFWYGEANPTYEIGNFYHFPEDDVASSISWFNFGGNTPGQYIQFSIYQLLGPLSIPLPTSAPLAQVGYTLDANHANQWVTLNLPDLQLLAGETYWLSCTSFMGSTDTLYTFADRDSTSTNSWLIINDDPYNAGLPGALTRLRLNTASSMDACGDFAVASQVNHVTCSGLDNGSVILSEYGEMNTPYSYLWNDNTTNNEQTGLAPGSLSATITNTIGCSITYDYDIQVPTPLLVNTTITDDICETSVGKIITSTTGGSPYYSYQWSTGDNTQDLEQIGMGEYILTVTDDVSCSQFLTLTVNGSGSPNITLTPTQPTCGNSDGIIAASATSATSPTFTYLWNTGSSDQTIFNLGVANFQVTVTSDEGCSSISNTTLFDNILMTTEVSNSTVLCHGNSTTVTATSAGGTSPYSYEWSGSPQTSETITGVAVGTYSCTATDAAGCRQIATHEVTQPSATYITFNVTNSSCYQSDNGTLTPSMVDGVPPYGYNWSTGNTTASLSNLSPGAYHVTITDSLGCVATNSRAISEPDSLEMVFYSTPPSCYQTLNGSISPDLAGGTPPYDFSWNFLNSTASELVDLGEGFYEVVVTDALGCQVTDSTTFTYPDEFTVGIEQGPGNIGDTCWMGPDLLSGGVPPFTYEWTVWSNVASTDSILSQYSFYGVYKLEMTDAQGCVATYSEWIVCNFDNVEELPTEGFEANAYPNPVHEMLQLKFDKIDEYQIQVIDPIGRILWSRTIRNNEQQIDMSGYATGLYTIKLANQQQSQIIKVSVK